MYSILFDFFLFHTPHIGEADLTVMFNVITKWGLQGTVRAVKTDNTADVVLGMR